MKTITSRIVNFFLIAAFFLLPFSTAQALPAVTAGRSSTEVIAPNSITSAIYNTNLVPDGDAEGPWSTYWHDNEGFTTIVAYGDACGGNCHFPGPYDVGPAQRGSHFFYMGSTSNTTNGTNLWLNDNNKISLAPIQTAVNSGKVRYILSGYFGGDTTASDTAQFHIFFESDAGSKGEVIIGNVTPSERQYKTGLIYRQATGFLPAGTQRINLLLQSGHLSGAYYRTGYADNLSLVLNPVKTFLPFTTSGPPNQPPSKTALPAPSGVIVLPDGLTRMGIYWTDNSGGELGFEVQRINQDASVDTVCNTKPNVTYCIDPGVSQSGPYGYIYLGNQKTYTYQVRAIGAGISSAWVSAIGTTAQEPLAPPSATPGSFTCQAIDVTSSAATFVWNNPFNYEAGFNIYVGSNSTPTWSMLEDGTKISFINQAPGSITLRIVPFVFDRNNPAYVYEGSPSCTATANLPSPPPSNTGITYFHNNASYPVISLVVDGWEQFPVRPLGILSGAYYELDGVPAGQHTWTAITGFWDDWGQRFSMYTYTGTYTQPASGPRDVTIPDMTIQDLLTVPPTNLGYWEGYYFDAYANCWTTAFRFYSNGTFDFYNANTKVDNGTYSLVQREPDIFSTKFHINSSHQSFDGLLVETHGEFFMKNGPPSWQQITYVYKPQGYVRNAFCP
jgi:hypothetical protein